MSAARRRVGEQTRRTRAAVVAAAEEAVRQRQSGVQAQASGGTRGGWPERWQGATAT